MAMAYWNGMTWGVSNKEIAFMESLTTAFSLETKTNADKDGNSPTETVAPSLVEISLNTTYRVETGTRDIHGKINAWKALVGKTSSLVIGGSIFGPDKMQLQSVGVSNLRVDAKGVMREVTLSLKFKEYGSGSAKGTSSKDSGTGTFKYTAVNTRPSAEEKEANKTVTATTTSNTTTIQRKTTWQKERVK